MDLIKQDDPLIYAISMISGSNDPLIVTDKNFVIRAFTPHACILIKGLELAQPLSNYTDLHFESEVSSAAVYNVSGKEMLFIPLFQNGDIHGYIISMPDPISKSSVGDIIKDDHLSRFMADMSHEFNMPLTVIISALSLLRQNTPPNEKNDKYFDIAQKNAKKLLMLTQSLISISKLYYNSSALSLTNIDLVPFLSGICKAACECPSGNVIPVIFETQHKSCLTGVDPFMIERAVLNLLINSFKYTRPGNRINVTLTADTKKVNIIVADRGLGISPELMGSIFDRFKRGINNAPILGNGIGLSLVKTYIEMHGGSVDIKSVYGEGTTVTLTIPNVKAENEHPAFENYGKDYITNSLKRLENKFFELMQG